MGNRHAAPGEILSFFERIQECRIAEEHDPFDQIEEGLTVALDWIMQQDKGPEDPAVKSCSGAAHFLSVYVETCLVHIGRQTRKKKKPGKKCRRTTSGVHWTSDC